MLWKCSNEFKDTQFSRCKLNRTSDEVDRCNDQYEQILWIQRFCSIYFLKIIQFFPNREWKLGFQIEINVWTAQVIHILAVWKNFWKLHSPTKMNRRNKCRNINVEWSYLIFTKIILEVNLNVCLIAKFNNAQSKISVSISYPYSFHFSSALNVYGKCCGMQIAISGSNRKSTDRNSQLAHKLRIF